jgi:tetratricopeptide (TPR) repeat protein
LQAQRRWELASRAFEAAVKYGQVNLQTWHLADVAELSAACLALTLQILGRDDQARDVLDQALGRHPDSLRLRRQLVDLHVKHARIDDAVRAAGPLASDWLWREALRNAVRGACQASARNWTAALAYLQSAYLAGCRDPICLRGLAVVLLSTGQAQAAVPLLRQWRDVEPGNAELRAYLDAVAQASRTAAGRPPRDTEPAPHRWLRIDPAASVVDTSAFPMPIVSQVSSAD